MTERFEVYECEVCGNVVEVLRGRKGQLSCCNQEMKRLDEKTADQTTEKLVPVIEKTAEGYKVTVGSTLHPMTDEHYIEWIELLTDDRTCVTFLTPGDAPEAVFCTDAKAVTAREHCNVHGLWKNNY